MILFVVLVFLFQDFTGGFEPHLPWDPNPDLKPRDFARIVDPLDMGWLADLAFCFAVPTVCNVCFLQYGQYRFVSLGNFMIRDNFLLGMLVLSNKLACRDPKGSALC